MRFVPLPLLVAACAAPAIAPTGTPTFRDPGAILSSQAGFEPARLAGRWHEVARFPDGACMGGTVDYRMAAGGLAVTETCGGLSVGGSVEPAGPGRLEVRRGAARSTDWVLWMDADARTIVLAHPDGSGGRILDRGRTMPPDRRRAAETVLEFNGFDPARLVYAG